MKKNTAIQNLKKMKKKELSRAQIREAFDRARERRRAAEKVKNQKQIER